MNKTLSWFVTGTALGATMLSISIASVPKGRVTDDTQLYQNLSELKMQKERDLNLDSEVARLASLESRYREDLPRVRTAAKRVAKQKYIRK